MSYMNHVKDSHLTLKWPNIILLMLSASALIVTMQLLISFRGVAAGDKVLLLHGVCDAVSVEGMRT